ncbi:hypothetical protein MPTK1_8g10600 [Marchantia polymorpha subsp. ruderalis]|uniref:ENT domain-containing protein n=1 Tax=Marchantia polymorpha TaxID=3197 RepID=A0A2R6XMS2_MARPO|nr:hypothetical protein MARPO_0008s0163 [Marchantia polymorpha]BBN19423.1 hypothetical protein Mp_8g10600 [Marchantia polymorpha subsp. ruderalis]|eukprot:PTQ47409.1 hypothetical protein MARPO_0008s0163 [Marchantia polymorpha]
MVDKYESGSGTDDDHPAEIFHKQPLQAQGARGPVGKRSARGRTSEPLPVMEDTDLAMLELEAYTAVLRAFGAQPTALTWSKERIMCDLRKELRISEEQHRQLAKELEARQLQGSLDISPSATISDMHLAINSLRPASSTGIPHLRTKSNISHVLGPQASDVVAPHQKLLSQPSLETARSQTGGRGKNLRLMTPPSNLQRRCSLSSGNPTTRLMSGGTSSSKSHLKLEDRNEGPNLQLWQNFQKVSTHFKGPDKPSMGQKVQRWWPDEKKFYDAVIVEYDEESGKHALAYDMRTPQQSIEWVDLKAIPRFVRYVEEPPVSILGVNLKSPIPRGRGRGRTKVISGHGRAKWLMRTPASGLGIGREDSLSEGNARKKDATVDINVRKGRVIATEGSPHGEPAGEAVTVQVPITDDLFEEAASLDEIVDPERLAFMKQKVNKITKALRTALRDLGESSSEDEDHPDRQEEAYTEDN